MQAFLPDSRMVKAFNHLGYHDLEDRARPRGSADRVGIAVAADEPVDLEAVADLVGALGFDPVIAGPLAEGVRFEPGTELFGAVEPVTRYVFGSTGSRTPTAKAPSPVSTASR